MPPSAKKVKVKAERKYEETVEAADARVAAGIELFRQALNESDAGKWEAGAKLLMRPDPERLVAVKDDDGDSDDDDGMIMAKTERASRAARSPPPSDAVQEAAWETTTQLAAAFEACDLVRIARVAIAPPPKTRAGPREQPSSVACASSPAAAASSSSARPTAQLSHVFSLQRPIDANARESSFLTYQTVLPLESFQLAAAGMRSNSVRASVVHKAKKTQGGGQQTTRNSLQDLSASFAAQSVSVAVAMGVARRAFGRASDPGATIATNLAQFVDGATAPRTGPFVVTSSTRLLPHALPIRIGAHNLMTTMRGFASRELEAGMIRSLVPQQVASLKSICVKICDRADGVNVWAAWVLLIHMLSDPRLRKLVRESPITDHEVSAAYLFTNYARRGDASRAHGPDGQPKAGQGRNGRSAQQRRRGNGVLEQQ